MYQTLWAAAVETNNNGKDTDGGDISVAFLAGSFGVQDGTIREARAWTNRLRSDVFPGNALRDGVYYYDNHARRIGAVSS